MPNRILRDWTDSYNMDGLDANAERFFTRLIMKVDDFGRFHADPRLLRSNLFPLKPEIRDTDITRWLAACEKAGLVRCYCDAKSRNYLEINKFDQRKRAEISKYPDPCQTNDGQMTVIGQSNDGLGVCVFEGVAEGEGVIAATDEPSPTSKQSKPVLSDEEWIESLASNPAYQDIDVRQEYGKMVSWCSVFRKQPTRRRFVNWLNRCDKPMKSVHKTEKPMKESETW